MWSPTSRRCSVRHSNTAAQPCNTGRPHRPGVCSTPVNLSGTALAKRRDNSTCSSASTLMTKRPVASKAARLGEARRRLHSTMGGCNETELKELAVTPTGEPWASNVLTMVTPVPNRPSARRRSVASMGG